MVGARREDAEGTEPEARRNLRRKRTRTHRAFALASAFVILPGVGIERNRRGVEKAAARGIIARVVPPRARVLRGVPIARARL